MLEEDRLRAHLSQQNADQSTGPSGMHWRVLRELAHAMSLWTTVVIGEVPEELDRMSIIPNMGQGEKESLGSYSLPSHPSVPGKLREKILLEATSKYLKDKKGMANSQ